MKLGRCTCHRPPCVFRINRSTSSYSSPGNCAGSLPYWGSKSADLPASYRTEPVADSVSYGFQLMPALATSFFSWWCIKQCLIIMAPKSQQNLVLEWRKGHESPFPRAETTVCKFWWPVWWHSINNPGIPGTWGRQWVLTVKFLRGCSDTVGRVRSQINKHKSSSSPFFMSREGCVFHFSLL